MGAAPNLLRAVVAALCLCRGEGGAPGSIIAREERARRADMRHVVARQPPRGGKPSKGGMGGGASTPSSSSPHAGKMLGSVAFTTVSALNNGVDTTWATGVAGEDIYGPFEAGFTSNQDFILEGLGCADGSDGHLPGGIDTVTAESMVAHACGVELPRYEDGEYVSLIDECGGHTREYHYHERLTCLYDAGASGHSTKVGEAVDENATPIYGGFEDTDAHPDLDACGAHFGITPDSNGESVYHHHVQEKPPFIVGCFGPNDDGGLVTYEQCVSYYGGCDQDWFTVTMTDGVPRNYDLWCPCFVDGWSDPADAVGGPTPRPTIFVAAPAPAPTPFVGAPSAAPTPFVGAPSAAPVPPPTAAPRAAPTAAPFAPPTAGPTAAPRFVVRGEITLAGLALADALANGAVVAAAVATSAGVAVDAVDVAFEVAGRRRLSDGVVARYSILAEAEAADDAVAALGVLTPSAFDAALSDAADDAGAASAFAAVVTEDVAAVSSWAATAAPTSVADPAPTAAAGDDDLGAAGDDASCRYANDGECDEPRYCEVGTDGNDCREGAGGAADDLGALSEGLDDLLGDTSAAAALLPGALAVAAGVFAALA